MKSFAQDLMFEVSREKIKPPKQMLLPYAVKTVTDNVRGVAMIFQSGGVTLSQNEVTHQIFMSFLPPCC